MCKLVTLGPEYRVSKPALPFLWGPPEWQNLSVQLYFLPSKGVGEWAWVAGAGALGTLRKGASGKEHFLSEPLCSMPELLPLIISHRPQQVLLSMQNHRALEIIPGGSVRAGDGAQPLFLTWEN